MIEQTLWHVHVDAKKLMEDSLRDFLLSNGFYNTDFLQERPFGVVGAPPPLEHLTQKFNSFGNYQDAWKVVERVVRKEGGFIGYLEGEQVSDIELLSRPRPAEIPPVLFTLFKRRLAGGLRESFRQDEVHVVMDWNKSDRRIAEALVNAGMGVALMPKPNHQAVVLTAQGFRKDIGPLAKRLLSYCSAVGGMVNASLKREVVKNFSLFGMKPEELPEIVDRVYYSR